MTDFTQGDTVYTQDGTNYYFDHVAGEHGYVSPIILIQTTNYSGDDFDEHEEVADHMIPIRLDHLSKEPWTRKIHAETVAMLAKRQEELDAIGKQIGAARIAKSLAEKELADTESTFERDKANLRHRYNFVRDFLHLTGDKPSFVVCFGDDPVMAPHKTEPQEMRLRRQSYGSGNWDFVVPYDEGDDIVEVFPAEINMTNEVRSRFLRHQKDMTIVQELAWLRNWPDLPVSEAALEHMAQEKEAKRLDNLHRAEARLAAAKAEVEKYAQED